jgi:hypothetical protein
MAELYYLQTLPNIKEFTPFGIRSFKDTYRNVGLWSVGLQSNISDYTPECPWYYLQPETARLKFYINKRLATLYPGPTLPSEKLRVNLESAQLFYAMEQARLGHVQMHEEEVVKQLQDQLRNLWKEVEQLEENGTGGTILVSANLLENVPEVPETWRKGWSTCIFHCVCGLDRSWGRVGFGYHRSRRNHS